MPEDVVSRNCIVNGKGGSISIIAQVTNAMRFGGTFFLLDTSDQETERHRVTAGQDGKDEAALNAAPGTLHGFALTWRVNLCAFIPGANDGQFEVLIMQDGVTCPMTKPAHWTLANVPNCADNKKRTITSSLEFLVR